MISSEGKRRRRGMGRNRLIGNSSTCSGVISQQMEQDIDLIVHQELNLLRELFPEL
jgi:hypothetical protein